jgi:nucleoside phosphorylase
MEAMEIHLQTDHRDELSDNSLSTLLSWSAVQAMGIKTCPFCSSHGPEDAPDLVDHVLREGYEFALRALPWPKPIDHDLNEPPGVFNFSDRDDGESLFGRWIREPVLEDENAVDLELCPYDRADHSEPINFDEYTDYFDKGGYFGDKAGDNSSAAEANTAHSKSMSAEDYTVGWVCALAIEHIAATGMLDEIHPDTISKPANDPNGYTLGSIGGHNIVIACLPEGQYGTNSPATVATWMVSTFPRIRFGLMVGIGSGVPPKVRLGDVVVGCPVAQFPGVVQWDMGKAKAGGKFELAGALNNPPRVLLAALGKLKVDHEIVGTKVPEYLRGMVQKWPRLSEYLRSDALEDVLFKATYPHVEADEEDEEAEEESVNCPNCSRTMTVERRPRDAKVHYGLIASANRVIKDALLRDQLSKDLGKEVLCLEMEAAGLMNNFPCIVIRGICDYADSHKNRDWQRHAAAMAAGFAKELLQYVSPADVDEEPTVKDILAQREFRLFFSL